MQFRSGQRTWRVLLAGMLAGWVLTGCGGGGGGGGGSAPAPVPVAPLSASEAARVLTQGSFGPTEASIDALVTSNSISNWISQQIATPIGPETHLANLDAQLVALLVTNSSATLGSQHFLYSWWKHAMTQPDQLRQRMAFALSQIFVTSLSDPALNGSTASIRGVGSYYDTLTTHALGNYRQLLEQVTLHPVMGTYLTYLGNQKEDAAGTRTPDENYAREVLQLMSIGLYELNLDGSIRLDASGNRIPAYTPADIENLAKVFTGWSWFHPTPSNNTFLGRNRDSNGFVTPMIAYPAFYSTSAKTFLGLTIPAQASPTAATMSAELAQALDRIANHANVAPFISSRLIQQLVTSNPSPAYIARVSGVFNNNGSGVRGDLAAVVRAILTDTEARSAANVSSTTFGKLREPVLRLGHFLRVFGATSTSGTWLIGSTSANTALSQSPMSSPSVFNFWRPGYVPPGTTQTGALGLKVPELQAVDEVSVAGYVNSIQDYVTNGIGVSSGGLRDVRPNYTAELAIADSATALVNRMDKILLNGAMSTTLRTRVTEAVNAITIPSGTSVTQAQIDAAKLNRVRTAVLLSLAGPDYLIQR